MEHDFKTGDKIMRDTSRLPITYANPSPRGNTSEDLDNASRKLRHRFGGQCTLGEKFGQNAFELTDLPRAWRVHNLFNVYRLKHCIIGNPQPKQPPPPLVSTRSGHQLIPRRGVYSVVVLCRRIENRMGQNTMLLPIACLDQSDAVCSNLSSLVSFI